MFGIRRQEFEYYPKRIHEAEKCPELHRPIVETPAFFKYAKNAHIEVNHYINGGTNERSGSHFFSRFPCYRFTLRYCVRRVCLTTHCDEGGRGPSSSTRCNGEAGSGN